jgi:D-alanyl-D-alanine carboxypeptidase (penicillin-binding protein 5/6)
VIRPATVEQSALVATAPSASTADANVDSEPGASSVMSEATPPSGTPALTSAAGTPDPVPEAPGERPSTDVVSEPDASGAASPAVPVAASPLAASPVVEAPVVEAVSAVALPPAPEPPARRRRERARHRRTRRPWRFILATLAVIVALVIASGIIVDGRLHDRPPLAKVRSTLVSSRLVAGNAPALPWPAGVQSAIAIPALGITAQSGPEVAEPIASVTKLMTAHIVLSDHPLSAGEEGPTITIAPLDVTLYEEAVESDQANIQVAVGEVLTERQMLEGMLVHSANNFADLLAIWDAGSISAFVTKMNATASSLGMTNTQYADASGYSAQSVSTPADQLKVATLDVANPVFDQIVDMPTVTLPVGGTVPTYTPLLGVDGVVGVKSGFTSAAGGCDVLALLESVHGTPVVVLAAVVGNRVGTDVITGAGLEALSIARPAMSSVQSVDLAPRGTRLAVATASGHTVSVVARSDLSVLAWPGQRITASLHVARRPRAGAPAGWAIGTVTVRAGPEKLQVAVRIAKHLPSPTFLQRVF